MNDTTTVTTSRPDHIVPFYSERTLASLHRLVAQCDSDIAVYSCDEQGFATIGTRGVRPFDGTPGLIVHLSVYLRGDDPRPASSKVMPSQLLHNMAHTSMAEHQVKALLIETLEKAGLAAAGTASNDGSWHYF